MAWRFDEHILRGEIDNRTRGRVTGRLWLAGVEGPLVLDLRGDCHPDLTGCFLTFENPRPVPMTTRPPAAIQRGDAGDITAARKVRVFDIPFEEAYAMLTAGGTPPEHMANSLYLEWSSDLGGRMVIESSDYRLQVSAPAWRFTAEELAGGTDLSETDEALGTFTTHFMTLHVKLASALDFIAHGRDHTDPGLIIAWLKRALEIHNETLAAATALEGHPHFPAARLAHYRAGLFTIRADLLAVIAQLRASPDGSGA